MISSTTNSPVARNAQGGFTLVELSIVLVIIGLIVGGVLVGQDLIRAAETRAIMTQLEKYNTAVNTFKLKYGILAGDAPIPGDTTNTIGDNNGLLTPTVGNPTGAPTTAVSEIAKFWQQLSQAGFIEGSFTGVGTSIVLTNSATATNPSSFPSTKPNRGGIIAYGMPDGNNYYHVGLTDSASTTTGGNTANGVIKTADNLRPEEAFNIDKKIDDSNPVSGAVLARGGTALEEPASSTAGTGCIVANATVPSANVYNLTALSPACQVRVKFN